MTDWHSLNQQQIPDFIISGAMKSGTSTLHKILAMHPKVFIPEGELHFFDHDDINEHPDFRSFSKTRGEWQTNTKAPSFDAHAKWYQDHFKHQASEMVLGEDSTTYLASTLAFRRIAEQQKPIKIIVMLRHPTARAYSQYWHELRAGRAIYSFEKSLEYMPGSLLSRSSYSRQLHELYKWVPKEHVMVIAFEDFLVNKMAVLARVCNFIGVDKEELPEQAIHLHENSAQLPRSIVLQVMKNKLLRQVGNQAYKAQFDHQGNAISRVKQITPAKAFHKFHSLVNPLVEKKPPKMNASTKRYLDNYFKHSLADLDEITGEPILNFWFSKES